MGEVIAARFSRRHVLQGSLAISAIAATVGPTAVLAAESVPVKSASRFAFSEVEAGVDATHHIAAGYDARILLRWGDPLFPDAPDFDPLTQSAEKQRRNSATITTMSASYSSRAPRHTGCCWLITSIPTII